jgi:hypothetical protein
VRKSITSAMTYFEHRLREIRSEASFDRIEKDFQVDQRLRSQLQNEILTEINTIIPVEQHQFCPIQNEFKELE